MMAGMKSRSHRPLLRPRNIALLALVILVGWFGIVVYRTWNLQPNIAVDYGARLEELAASVQPEGRDAWPLIMELFAIRQRAEQEISTQYADLLAANNRTLRDYVLSLAYPPGTDVTADLAYLDRLEALGFFDLLEEIAECPRAIRPMAGSDRPLYEVLDARPHSGEFRRTCMIIRSRMRQAALAGDFDSYVRDLSHGFALNQHLANQPSLVCYLSATAVTATYLQSVCSDMDVAYFGPDGSRRVLETLTPECLPRRVSYAMQSERYWLLDMVQRVYSDDHSGDGTLIVAAAHSLMTSLQFGNLGIGSRLASHPVSNLAGGFYPSRQEMISKIDEYFLLHQQWSNGPFPRGADVPNAPAEFLNSLSPKYFLLTPLAGWGEGLGDLDIRLRSLFVGTRLHVTVHRFFSERLFVPVRLESLTPRYLDSFPLDPLTGQSFGFRSVEPQEMAPFRRWEIYSFGPDGVDNYGVEEKNEAGQLDIVINRLTSIWVPP